jgi:hypothetical protein
VRVLETLLRDPGPHEYIVAGRDIERARRMANLGRQYASAFGQNVSLRSVVVDAADVAATTATIASIRPDIVFFAVTLQSWWVTGTLAPELEQLLAPSCVGPWLPMHLTLVYELMTAVRAADIDAVVVNCSYPDVTHPVLAKIGLAPDVGIGNIAIPLVGLRLHLAEEQGIPVADVHLRAVFHHYVNYMATRTGDPSPAPFYLRAWAARGTDRSSAPRPDGVPLGATPLPIDQRTVFAPLTTRLKRASGPDYQHVTGATAGVILRALLDGDDIYTHAPGPLGLPGGYPIRIQDGHIDLALPSDIDLQSAVRLNERGAQFDGIERIADDGTVHFREENAEPLRAHLGFDCAPLKISETRARAEELLSRFDAFAKAAVPSA